MKKNVAVKNSAKRLITLSLIGINLFSPQLLNVHAEQDVFADSALTMDDTANIINGLNETHMWSNDGGTTWKQGKEGQLFRGEQEVQVARFDKDIVESQAWQGKAYSGGTLVSYNGAIWQNKWYAESTEEPGVADVWVKVKEIPAPIAIFNFSRFTGAEADKLQKDEAERVQNQKKVIGYFSNWHGYKTDYQPDNPDYNISEGVTNGKGYDPDDVPFDKISHVNYAFMIIDSEGNLVSNDAWADFDESHTGGGKDYINQIVQKAEENDVAAMVSIGGWTNSVDDKGFDHATATPERIDRFTDQLVEFMINYGFDGIDLDWEYPENNEQKEKFVVLVKQLREKMTAVGKENDQYYQLSAAVTANHEKMAFIAPEITKDYLDSFNVMTYDFRGGFDTQTGHQAPLYPTSTDKDQKFNVSAAMEEYHNVYGIPKNKLMVGMSYYSRGFANVNEAGIGVSSNGAPIGGTWDDPAQAAGLKPWWQLKDFEAQAKDETVKHLSYHWDDEAKAPYIYDSQKKELYTYDNIETISRKVNYTIDNGYGGAIIWELAHDTPETAELTSIVNNVLTGERVDIEDETETGNKLITAEVKDREVQALLTLDEERFNSEERIMVYVDGKYHFETYAGKSYYSSRDKADGSVQIRRKIEGKKGQKIEVYTAPRKPGHSSAGKTLLETFVLDDDLTINTDGLMDAVKNIEFTGSQIRVSFDEEAYKGENRMIIRKNGAYVAEVYNGKHYYSSSKKEGNAILITRNFTATSGDIFSVELSGGRPGGSSNNLETLATLEVK
ncbi:carbohydrate binding domain protein [Enterococcus faecalis 13-SD-W-01]|nr:carbohydrate binding domain protein [Enterococcus faecalis 13-SD-W-01]